MRNPVCQALNDTAVISDVIHVRTVKQIPKYHTRRLE